MRKVDNLIITIFLINVFFCKKISYQILVKISKIGHLKAWNLKNKELVCVINSTLIRKTFTTSLKIKPVIKIYANVSDLPPPLF